MTRALTIGNPGPLAAALSETLPPTESDAADLVLCLDLDASSEPPSAAALLRAIEHSPAGAPVVLVWLALAGTRVAMASDAAAPIPMPRDGPARRRRLLQERLQDVAQGSGRAWRVVRIFDPMDANGLGPSWLREGDSVLADGQGIADESEVSPIDATVAAAALRDLVRAGITADSAEQHIDVGGPAVVQVGTLRAAHGLASLGPGGWHRVGPQADRVAGAGAERIGYVRPHVPPTPRLLQRMAHAVRSGQMTNGGPLVRALEAQLGGRHPALAVSSGNAALLAILRLAPAGRPVVVPAFTFAATANAVLGSGRPVRLADVDPERWVLTPATLSAALSTSPEAGAVLAVNAFGEAPDLPALAAVCAEHGCVLLLDNAHGVGGPDPIAAGAVAAAHSLHATKVLPAAEGGFATFADAGARDAAAQWRNHGIGGPGRPFVYGQNVKLSELHAAVALETLSALPELLTRRRADEAALREVIGALPGSPLVLQRRADPALHSAQNLVVRVRGDVGAWSDGLARRGIDVRRYFHPSLQALDYLGPQPETPVADALCASVLALPLHNRMDPAGRDRVAAALRDTAAELAE